MNKLWPCHGCAYAMPAIIDDEVHKNVIICKNLASKHAEEQCNLVIWVLLGWPRYCPQRSEFYDVSLDTTHFLDHPYRT